MSASISPQARTGSKARLKRAGRAIRRRTDLARAGLGDRTEDILSSILNISSEGLVVTDGDMRILLFSPGAQAIFGYGSDEMVGRPLERLIPPPHRIAHRRHVMAFGDGPIESRRMAARAEVTGLTKSGREVPLEVGLSRLATRRGTIYAALVRDVSERRTTESALAQAAAEARAANEAKSVFLAAMSHEIRTPLNGVLGMAQAMAMEDVTPQQQERLSVIRQSGESLLSLLNDLLDLSKIEAGKLELEDAEFDLQSMVGDACATFVALARSKGLDFRVEIGPSAAGVYRGDSLRLRQILHNLVSNAIKFTEQGEIRVSVRRHGETLAFAVEDTGIGIPPEKAARLFEKFEQGDTTTTRRFGGTGLGLAICRDLVQMMGGSIEAGRASRGGARFEVAVPLVRVRASRRRARTPAPTPQPARRRGGVGAGTVRVLVAEDNGMNQLVLKTLLAQIGIEPVIVSNGRAAVEAWESGPWDLILMDVQMPEMDGPTATEVIRTREAAEGRARTTILALTANAMRHQAEEYAQAGMDGLIPKPLEAERLYQAIANLNVA